MPKSIDLTKPELWTQKEVAEYFRVSEGTIKNWRDQELLSFWRVPGRRTILYYRDEIINFRDNYTNPKKGGDRQKPKFRVPKGKPVVSENDEDWRI